jgi:hypothetical protein
LGFCRWAGRGDIRLRLRPVRLRPVDYSPAWRVLGWVGGDIEGVLTVGFLTGQKIRCGCWGSFCCSGARSWRGTMGVHRA